MQAVEMDTFILISPGGISEGTRPEGPGKTPPGKAITASPSHHACHPLAGERACSSAVLPVYVGPRGLLTFATHTHAYTQKGRRTKGRERERRKRPIRHPSVPPGPGRNGITASIVRRRQRWPPHCCASCLSKHKHTQLQQQWSRWIVGRPPVRPRPPARRPWGHTHCGGAGGRDQWLCLSFKHHSSPHQPRTI